MNKMLNVQDFILDAYKTYSATVFKAIRFTLLLFILMIACFVIAHYAVEDIMLKSKVFLVIAIIMVPVYIFLPLIGQIKCAFGYYKANSEVNPDTSYEHAYATDLIGPSFRKFLPVLFAALLMSVPVSLVSLCMYLAGVKSVLPYVIVNFISLLTLFFTSVFVMPFIALEEENPIKAFKRSAMLIIPNLHSVALCLFLSICVFLAIYIPLSLMSYFLRAFLASHIQEIVISIVMMGQFMAILTIIGFLLLSKSITIAINYIPITMYSVLFGKLLEVEQAFKINTTKRPEDIKLKTTTQKVKHDIDEKILNRIESTQSVISSIDQLNEGENKKERSFFSDVEVQETASDEMPTLVFDMDSAEAQELMKTAPLPKPDEAGKDPESTIVASGHGLEIKKQDEDYIPRKASAPPPPPTKNKF